MSGAANLYGQLPAQNHGIPDRPHRRLRGRIQIPDGDSPMNDDIKRRELLFSAAALASADVPGVTVLKCKVLVPSYAADA